MRGISKTAILAVGLLVLACWCGAWSFGPKIIKGPLPSVTAAAVMPPGVNFHWVSTNFADNEAITDWYDLITSNDLKQASALPMVKSNSLEGVWFHAAAPYRYATNTPRWYWPSNGTLAIIFQDATVAYTDMAFCAGYAGAQLFELLLTGTSASDARWRLHGTIYTNLSSSFDVTGLQDLVISRSNSYFYTYTNGVFSNGFDYSAGNFEMQYWGGNANSAVDLNARMIEILAWTNVNDFSAYASSFHNYAQTKYNP